MKKIKSLYKLQNSKPGVIALAYNEFVPTSKWVIDPLEPKVATEKFDGSCCLVRENKVYARYDLKPTDSAFKKHKKDPNYSYVKEDFKTPPVYFEVSDNYESISKGHIMGWVPIDPNNTAHKYHFDAISDGIPKEDGTYELVGPKVQGNPYELTKHELWKHGSVIVKDVPVDFEELKKFLQNYPKEGIVWHRLDGSGDMVKMRRDYFWVKD